MHKTFFFFFNIILNEYIYLNINILTDRKYDHDLLTVTLTVI